MVIFLFHMWGVGSDVHWKLPTKFSGIGSIIGIGRFGLPKVLPIFTKYKIYMFLCALEASNNFLLELEVLLELEDLEVQMCFQLPMPITGVMNENAIPRQKKSDSESRAFL